MPLLYASSGRQQLTKRFCLDAVQSMLACGREGQVQATNLLQLAAASMLAACDTFVCGIICSLTTTQ